MYDDVFDGIVYGERTAGQWMNGSDYFRRTPYISNGGATESEIINEAMIAIVYEADGSIEIPECFTYASIDQSNVQAYSAGQSFFLLGLRHSGRAPDFGTATGNDAYLAAEINEAAVYGEALTAAQIQLLWLTQPIE